MAKPTVTTARVVQSTPQNVLISALYLTPGPPTVSERSPGIVRHCGSVQSPHMSVSIDIAQNCSLGLSLKDPTNR